MAFAGVTSALSSGVVETNSGFRRSQSRVFYESDCSSPTSWEFRETAGVSSPIPMQMSQVPLNLSFRRVSCSTAGLDSPGVMQAIGLSLPLEEGMNSPKVDLRGTDGSRNSTGSSGSHRSQDSGFSDSGETRASRRQQSRNSNNSNKTHHSHSHSQNGNVERWSTTNSHHKKSSSALSIPPFPNDPHQNCNQRQQQNSPCLPPNEYHSHNHQRYFSSPSPVSRIMSSEGHCGNGQVMTNGTGAHFHISHQQDCLNCSSYHQGRRTPSDNKGDEVCSPVERPRSGLLGTPACCSTPKKSSASISVSTLSSKLSVMQKIDNFESLNKNMKTLDSNNNSKNNNNINITSGCHQSTNSNANGIVNANHERKYSQMNANHCDAKQTMTNGLKGKVGNGLATFIRSSSEFPVKNRLSTAEPVICSIPPGPVPPPSINHISNCNSTATTPTISQTLSSDDGCVPRPIVFMAAHEDPNSNTIRATRSPASPHSILLEEEEEQSLVNELSSYASRSKVFSRKDPKWQSLPKGYKRVPANSFTADGSNSSATKETDALIVVKSHFDNDAMRQWLHDLRQQTENECLHTLQNKSILQESENPQSISNVRTSHYGRARVSQTCAAIHAVSAPLQSIKNVERMASVISGEFARICKHLEFGMLTQVPYSVVSLVDNIGEFLRHFQDSRGFGNLIRLENRLATSCCELRTAAHSLGLGQNLINCGGNGGKDDGAGDTQSQNIYSVISETDVNETMRQDYQQVVGEVVEGVVSLGNLFSQVVDLRLTRDLSAILDTIEGGGLPAKVALRSFATVLSDGGMHLCRLASDIRTVRGLLGALLDAAEENEKMLALRCLATVLCVGEAVKDFDKAGGFEIIADLLCEASTGIRIKVEAVSVLTQATDPWIDLESLLGSLGIQLEKIIVALTNLISYVKLEEDSFLLVVSAISNLTFLEVASLDILRRYRTVTLLIDAVRNKPDFSIFVLDHVATILANMGGMEECREEIVRSGGILALLTFLQKRPSPTESTPEITACERLQQKSTIAISRLANEDGVAQQVLRMGGIQRLVQLSRNEKERNYSDGVLIACLATLRKLVTICGYDVVKQLNADDLINPRLLDSFLLYSSRQESYV